MKIAGLVIGLCLCLITVPCYAEKCYVFIEKTGLTKGVGHTEKGDVVGIYPYTQQYKPTRAELSGYKIMVADLTEIEQGQLTEPDRDIRNGIYYGNKRERKCRVDIDNLTHIGQEEEVDKQVILDKVVIKPIIISP